MADVDFDDFDGAYDAGWQGMATAQGRMTRIVHLAGAACSIALVIGMGWWGYRIAVRDVNGVPVVRALEGPMRVAPENPGGEVADHQGLAVNTVAALGTAAPPPDRLVLAPRPVELSPEDAAGLAAAGAPAAPDPQAPLAASDIAPSLAAPEFAVPQATLAAALPAPAENTGPDPDAVAQALAEALATPLDEPMPDGDDVAAGLVPAAAEGTGIYTRPRPRPAAITAVSADLATLPQPIQPVALADPGASPAMGAAEIDPSLIPAGTRLVQLGAFDTADQARAEWVKLSNQFGPLMDGKALVVQAAESGGRTFFRLRAHGFADEAEARGFCTTMLEQNSSCIPVEQR